MLQSRWLLISMLGASAFVCATARAQLPGVATPTAPPAAAPPTEPPPHVGSPAPAAGTAKKPPAAVSPQTEVKAPQADAKSDVESDEAPVEEDFGPARVQVHVRSNQPGVAFFYAKVAQPSVSFTPTDWTRLCLGECDARLKPGYYRFALSYGADEPIMAPNVFQPRQGSRFEGGYTDRSHQRLAGVLILGLGGVSSVASIATGVALANRVEEDVGIAAIAGGCVGALLSLLVGIPLAVSSDESSVTPRHRAP